jgi:hypothetical protein
MSSRMTEHLSGGFQVFISYRREKNDKDATLICNELTGAGIPTFLDKQNIPPGAHWRATIERAMSSCKIVFILIGKEFLKCYDEESGERRIDNDEDVVRQEIRLALELAAQDRLQVVPLLIDGADMPKPKYLPGDIQGVSATNALSVTPTNLGDMANLLDQVKVLLSERQVLGTGGIGQLRSGSSAGTVPTDQGRHLARDRLEEPRAVVPTVPAQSPPGVIGALHRGSGTWMVVVDGDQLILDNPESTSRPGRSLQFTPSSGVLSADGEHIVVADEGWIQLASAIGDQIQLKDPIRLKGTHKILGAWQLGNFLYIVRSATTDAEQVKVRLGDLSLVPWQPDGGLGPEPAWTSVVHCWDGTVAVGNDGRLLTSVGCPQLMVWGTMTGWTSLDYSTSSPLSGKRLEVFAGLRLSETGAVELRTAWRSNDAWQFGSPLGADVAEAVMITRPAMSPESTVIFLRSGDTSTRVTLAELLSPGKST